MRLLKTKSKLVNFKKKMILGQTNSFYVVSPTVCSEKH